MNKTLEHYQENLCENFGFLHLIGTVAYETMKAKLLAFCEKNQVPFAMAQGLLNCICASFNDKRKSLNKLLSRISVYSNGQSQIVIYQDESFQYVTK